VAVGGTSAFINKSTYKRSYPFIDGQVILTGWEEEISNVARNIMEEPSSKQ